ncbi:AraC family transcriptional regulator [Thalassiella azotivora]
MRVTVDGDGAATWTAATREPPSDLRRAVRRWTGWSEDHEHERRRREAASPHVLLMVQTAAPLDVRTADGALTVGSFVAGPGTRWTDTRAAGPSAGVHVELTAPAARRLLGMPLHELVDRVVPLDALGSGVLQDLTEQVHDANDWPARLDVVERALRGLATRAHQRGDDPPRWLAAAWSALATGTPVADAAQAVGVSRRHLSRRLSPELGLAPHDVHRLHRLTRARALLAGTDLPVATVAARCGYADHSHLVRECRALAGRAPTELRRP